MLKVIGIIPARGGSKGVPRKNIRLLAGKSLLAYSVESSLAAKRLDHVILSTDDLEIAETGRSLGVDVPFIRPAELSDDKAPTFPVVIHAVRHMEGFGMHFDAVCLLQPTNPFRTAKDIDACVELLETTGADSVVSVLRVPDQYNPNWVYWQNDRGEMTLSTGESSPVARRQDLPPAFHRDGTIYVTRRSVLYECGNLYGERVQGYELDPARSVNIDTIDDWDLAEKMLKVEISIKTTT